MNQRTIKFRAWDKLGKRFVPKGAEYRWGIEEQVITNPNVLFMQFTGLKDKNGKEIWEGDILVVPNDNYRPDNGAAPNALCSVVFKNGGFRTPEIAYTEVLEEKYCKDETEVIGNIHQNPELLNN